MDSIEIECESVLARNIRERTENIRKLAELIHLWYCHSDACQDEHAHDCTFHAETWEDSPIAPLSRLAYFDKAERVYNQFQDANQARQALMAFRTLNPKLLVRLISEL